MNRYIKIFILTFLAAGALACPVFAKDMKFEVNLDRDKIGLGEAAQLGLSFYDTQSMPAPDIGNIDGLDIHYIGPSTMMTVINGQVSSSVTHRYRIQPLKIGKFQLGPFSFNYKGNKYTSNMAFLEVTEEKAVPLPAATGEAASAEKLNLEDRIFLKLDIGKASAYVNELIPVTVKLYVNRLNVSDIQLPTFVQEGFSKVEFKEPKQYRERFGNVIYEVLEFKTSIFGTRPGDYKIGPAKIKCNVMVKKRLAQAPGMGDAFGDDYYRDSFFEDFYTHYERYPLELQSQEAQIVVSPLPTQGMPQDFSGAVGDYQFVYEASPVKVKAGDPVTVHMDINGNGNFNTVLVPKIESAAGFKAYEPEVKTEEGRKSFTEVLIPESEAVTQVPRASFTYFDPDKKEYKTINQGPISIQVEKGREEAPSQVVGPSPAPYQGGPKNEELARDIIYIKEAPGRWIGKSYGFYNSRVFWAFIFMPLLFLISFFVVQGRRARLRRDSIYAGRVMAFRASRQGLKALTRLSRQKDAKIFYETLFKTLQDYLGNRLNIPPAGITSDAVERALESKDADREILRKAKSLFDTCDRARFAFFSVEEYKLADDLKELQEIIKYFERNRL